MVAVPTTGRTFTSKRRVSIDDAASDGRMELDAVARFLQDVGNDDTDDAGLAELGLAWVARRASFVVHQPAVSREYLTMTTWCSGTGSRWAERRTEMRGDHGAHIDGVAIWVHLDIESGRPTKWGKDFASQYMTATQGRSVDAKLRHSKQLPEVEPSPWRFRKTDTDAFGHVNNAAYLAIAEEFFDVSTLRRFEVEWRNPSIATETLDVYSDGDHVWVTGAGDTGDLRITITGSESIDPMS